MAYVLNDQL